MLEITELVQDFKKQPREQFLKTYPYPVLLHQTNRGDIESESGFVTGVKKARRRATVMSQDPAAEIQTARSATGLLVFPVQRIVLVDDEDGVVVGRDQTCDVQLPYDKVSNRHARISFKPQLNQWTVEDLGATNGTFVAGARIEAGTPVPVASGAQVKFGTAALTFFLAPDFHEYLTDLLALTSG